VTALAIAAGCAPPLEGATCVSDCNCPLQQTCVLDGGRGTCMTGSNYCGGDAGPALFGTFTLNGGIAKPTGNTAIVAIWTDTPTADGGPSAQATVNADGTWQVQPSVGGQSYYLQGWYALNAGRAVPGPLFAQVASGQPVNIDVPTYQCTVWSELAMPTASAYLAGLIADVPSITDGTQVSNATVTASDGVRPTPFPLSLVPRPEDPFDNGNWAWGPLLPGDTPAHGTYAFTIEAPGYHTGTTCTVNNMSLTQVPSALSVPPMWKTTVAQTVSFNPPMATQVSFIGIIDGMGNRVPLGGGSYVEVQHAPDGSTVSVNFPAGMIGNVCSTSNGGRQCTLVVISVRQTVAGPGVNNATSSAVAFFNTTT
jgi:hypothetical protein